MGPEDHAIVKNQSAADVVVTGQRYLRLATTLLQRMRLASPAGGVWEAADVQWWSRRERATDRDGQLFWLDCRGEPLAAVILTHFGHSVQCDVLILPDDPGCERAVWRAAIGRADAFGASAEFPVRPDSVIGVAELTPAGLRSAGEPGVVSSWMEAAHRPEIPALAPGHRLLSRADAPDLPYPLIARNGPEVEERLGRCSLYRPELDLMVEAPDGRAAGYGLFWADPITGIGLVEPMRTEQAHQRRGIASYILAEGLERLAAHGCQRLKVSNDIGLYLRAGFRPLRTATAAIYTRSPTGTGHNRASRPPS
jgi:GNAT superfamily N-acetyltransferase